MFLPALQMGMTMRRNKDNMIAAVAVLASIWLACFTGAMAAIALLKAVT
jgi:hypothetical protein